MENILRIFQAASGNEIKLPKSYIFWLGSETGSNTEVFGIKPIVGSERYLGLMISSEFQAVENWNRIISNLPACVEHWSSFGLSVYGRTLMINSSLISKLWFLAPHTPIDQYTRDKVCKLVNKYFRKNKKVTAMSLFKRTLPTTLGGLGQVDIDVQLDNLVLKWIIKSRAGDPHLWNDFWRYNEKQLQLHFKTNTDLACLRKNWKRAKSPKHIFHLVVPAFKAWHRMEYKMKSKPPYVLAAMQLFDNIHLFDDNGNIITPSRGARRLLNCKQILHSSFNIGHLYDKNVLPWVLRTPAEMHQIFSIGHEISQAYWKHIFDAIPQYVKDIIQYSDYKSIGWSALPTALGNIDSVYHVNLAQLNFSATIDDNNTILSLSHFQGDDQFISKLKPISVSCISGQFRILGWQTDILSNENFHFDDMEESIEHIIGTEEFKHPVGKIKFGALFKKNRNKNKTLLQSLNCWGNQRLSWSIIFKLIKNCPFLPMKTAQLIHGIITDSVFDGTRLNNRDLSKLKGVCPYCQNCVASRRHMFFDCKIVKIFWNLINQFGKKQWPDYKDFEYSEIPILLSNYKPDYILKVTAIWALWIQWCKIFYEMNQISEEQFLKETLDSFKNELKKRINEIPSVAQWIKLITKRRVNEEFDGVSEKEFLLCYATSIKKCQPYVPISDGNVIDLIANWKGSGFFFNLSLVKNNKTVLDINFGRINQFFKDFSDPHQCNWSVHNHPAVRFNN